MSTHAANDRRTDTRPPDTHALAAELGVDATLLERFVAEHPAPDADVVLGWARTRGDLRIHPEFVRPELAAWIDTIAGRATEGAGVTDDDLRETRLRAHALRSILGGDAE